MKKIKVKQIFRQFLIAVVVFSLICPGSLWAKKEKAGAKVIVTKTDGQQLKGELLKVEDESLMLLIPESLAKVSIGIDEIDRIKVKRKSRKCIARVSGLFAGGAAGFAIGYNTAADPGGGTGAGAEIYAAILGAAIGAVTGLLIGSLIGKYISKGESYQLKGESPGKINKILSKLKKKARFKD